MTQSQINQIEKMGNFLYFDLPARQKKELEKAKEDYMNARKRCDHNYPDGKSAVSNLMFCNVCEICHWSDY